MMYKVDFKYENSHDLLDAVMFLYGKTVLDEDISKQERDILREYMIHGYSKETKKAIKVNLKMSTETINTNNYRLQKKGFLVPDNKNQRNKYVSEELIKLKTAFLEGDNKKVFLIHFVNEKVR